MVLRSPATKILEFSRDRILSSREDIDWAGSALVTWALLKQDDMWTKDPLKWNKEIFLFSSAPHEKETCMRLVLIITFNNLCPHISRCLKQHIYNDNNNNNHLVILTKYT
jgi:hypothetical protein